MSTLVNWNGQQYLVPAYNDTGYAQGNGNLSQYLVALSTGSLQQVGGLFQLTADADFGPNFGLVSSYYKSRTANIASAGVLRLANTDAIKWRNSDNSADVTLAMNATGTAARTYTIPDLATSSFVMTEGTQTINGAKTFGSAIIGSLTGAASLNLLLTGGLLTGQLGITAGTVSAPGIYVSGSTTTGIYSPGANQLALASNGSAGITINASQQINQPNNCSFFAYATSVANVTGNATEYTVLFDNEVQDITSSYNPSTGIFTAIVTGDYLLCAQVCLNQLAVTTHTDYSIALVTSARSINCSRAVVPALLTQDTLSVAQIIHLTAGQTAYVTAYVNGSSKVVDIVGGTNGATFFSGTLLN